jgi:hypothetical protein
MTDTPRLTPELVSMAIEGGMLDDSLTGLREVLNTRLDLIDRRTAASLEPGDRFYVKNCKPKKWNGVIVQFQKHDGMWLVCEAEPYGHVMRFRTSHVGTILRKGE